MWIVLPRTVLPLSQAVENFGSSKNTSWKKIQPDLFCSLSTDLTLEYICLNISWEWKVIMKYCRICYLIFFFFFPKFLVTLLYILHTDINFLRQKDPLLCRNVNYNGNQTSIHKALTLYRSLKENPKVLKCQLTYLTILSILQILQQLQRHYLYLLDKKYIYIYIFVPVRK